MSWFTLLEKRFSVVSYTYPNINIERTFLEFIEYVSPEILVTGNISKSLDLFNQELNNLKEQTVILEIDVMGAVTLTTKGEEMSVELL